MTERQDFVFNLIMGSKEVKAASDLIMSSMRDASQVMDVIIGANEAIRRIANNYGLPDLSETMTFHMIVDPKGIITIAQGVDITPDIEG